jgi:hypothetical protein
MGDSLPSVTAAGEQKQGGGRKRRPSPEAALPSGPSAEDVQARGRSTRRSHAPRRCLRSGVVALTWLRGCACRPCWEDWPLRSVVWVAQDNASAPTKSSWCKTWWRGACRCAAPPARASASAVHAKGFLWRPRTPPPICNARPPRSSALRAAAVCGACEARGAAQHRVGRRCPYAYPLRCTDVARAAVHEPARGGCHPAPARQG